MTTAATDFAGDLRRVLEEVEALLLEKNAAYGDSALNPLRLFAGDLDVSAQIRVRIDDKLSRLARGQRAGEDVELDLLGYLLLLRIARLRGPGGGEPPTQKRKAEPGAPSLSSVPPPPSASAPVRSPSTLRAARHYFEHRERRFRDVPTGVTWEAWLASPEGVAWSEGDTSETVAGVARNTRNAKRNAPQHPATVGATPSLPPSHSPSPSENAGELEEEEGARTGEGATRNAVATGGATLEAQRATPATATPATGEAQRATPDVPRDNAMEVLARASKGRVSPFASSRDQVALGGALADVGLVGAELEAFGAALAGDGAAKLWPKSEPAKGRAALTCGFFLGRAGDARMLADGVTRWRERQQRERDEAAALARIAAPVVKAGPTAEEMVARTAEIFRRGLAERRKTGVVHAG